MKANNFSLFMEFIAKGGESLPVRSGELRIHFILHAHPHNDAQQHHIIRLYQHLANPGHPWGFALGDFELTGAAITGIAQKGNRHSAHDISIDMRFSGVSASELPDVLADSRFQGACMQLGIRKVEIAGLEVEPRPQKIKRTTALKAA